MSNALCKTSDAYGEISQRIQHCKQLGLSNRAAIVFALACASTRKDVIALGPKFFQSYVNWGTKSLFGIPNFAGFSLEDQTCASMLAEILAPSLANLSRATAISKKTILTLRRFGYVITVRPRKP